MTKWIHGFFILTFLCLFFNSSAQSNISRIEPPFWWTNMQDPHLQLLIYGNQVGHLTPEIQYEGVKIEQIVKLENPNYLFINLLIGENAKPGTVNIVFKSGNGQSFNQSYELLEREPGSAQRKGYDNSDVLYLITPDRFANGSLDNDKVEGLAELPNRNYKGGRHGGDIDGILQHLDYIKDLGFTAIWLNPVLENNQESYSYHGYSTTDFYKVDPRFGSNASYREMSRHFKSKGIKFIMDMIVNHCGSEHWWMKDLPSDDWINFNGKFVPTIHRKTVLQDPYVSQFDRKRMVDGWFVKTMPDLNQRNPLLATYLIQNSIWWVEYVGLSGIRMDTYPYPDMDFMSTWTKRLMEEYPNFNIVGEEWTSNPALVSYWQRGKKNPNGYVSYLPGLMDFPLQWALANALNHEERFSHGWIELYSMLANDFLYPEPNNLVVFPDNHDMDRFITQVKGDFDLFKLGMVYILTTRGIPQLYYGTEILMANDQDLDDHGIIRSDFPGGWPGDAVNGFTGSGLTDTQLQAKAFLKKLLNWRKTAKAVHFGKLTHFEPREGVYVYFRFDEDSKVMVVLSKNNQPYQLDLTRFEEMIGEPGRSGRDVLSGTNFVLNETLEIPAKGALILELD